MNMSFWRSLGAMALIAAIVGMSAVVSTAAERMEEATVIGKDKSKQVGTVPTDTRATQAESKMKKETAPTGLKTDAPGVRETEKMEKPKLAEPERKKPEAKKRFGDVPFWIWLIVIGAIAAAAG